jgi:Metallo-beta-lactamase superfamily
MQQKLPDANQLVVSIFGKSSFYGECILVHLGNHEWLVKDSFHVEEKGKNIPIAQKYLQELYGNEWNKKIKYIVISHWHDDHLHGVSKLVNQAENLRYLFVSEAMSFNNLLELSSIDSVKNGINSQTKEVRKISNWRNTGSNSSKFFTINSSSVESINSKLIKFISPTPTIANRARDYIVSQIRLLQNKPGSVVISPKENSASAGIKLECDIIKASVLLGADIEDTWDEIIERLTSNGAILKSIIYKVAHHGSENGFDERVWTELLETDPISIITCWKGILPKIEFAKRIQNLSKETYITANTFAELEERKLQKLKTYGHVKCSYLDDERKWDVQAYETARNLSEILTSN